MNNPQLIPPSRSIKPQNPSSLKLKGVRKSMERQSAPFKYFIWWGGLVFVFLMAMNTTLFSVVLAPQEKFFFNLATAIIVSWTIILTLYFVWAIYFYNINGGKIATQYQRRDRTKEFPVDQSTGDGNPNSDETLGLPPGTVRGTLALSVLVVAMAMMIASLAMPVSLRENEVMIDHFEFLKTGFVMVIAFYFGTKSLEILRNRK